MTAIAVRPGASRKLTKVAWRVHNTFVTNNSDWSRYSGWGREYRSFYWTRFFVILFMLVAPVAFLYYGPFVLFGWLSFLVLPWSIKVLNKNTATNDLPVYASNIQQDLKDEWAEHGQAFYSQIWNHRCTGSVHQHSYRCNERKCEFRSNCSYCDPRLKELEALLSSQISLETKAVSEVDDTLLQLSQQFRERKAIELEGRALESEAMKEITNSVRTKK